MTELRLACCQLLCMSHSTKDASHDPVDASQQDHTEANILGLHSGDDILITHVEAIVFLFKKTLLFSKNTTETGVQKYFCNCDFITQINNSPV